ncbi:MAG: hypothetical protein KGL39_29360 [Patescibacteria group bacterium]|nr:hypothetical protein [Patescibacteria group bacterium]
MTTIKDTSSELEARLRELGIRSKHAAEMAQCCTDSAKAIQRRARELRYPRYLAW